MKTILSLLTSTLLLSSSALAKRTVPEKVAPVVTEEAIYSVPHFSNGQPHNGGVIDAHDPKTNKLLWRVVVYKVVYNNDIEGDVQDIFIKSLALDKDHGLLIMSDERDRMFVLDLATKKVTRLK